MENKGSQFVAGFVLKATSHLLAAKFVFIFILRCQTDGYEDKLLACCAAGNGLPNALQRLKEEALPEIVSELCNFYQLQVKKPICFFNQQSTWLLQSFWHHTGSLSQQLDPLMSLLA